MAAWALLMVAPDALVWGRGSAGFGGAGVQTGQNANVASLVAEAERRMREGATVEAEALLQRALTIDPESVAAGDAYGELLLGRQRLPEAMDRFEAALKVDPRDVRARAGERKAAVALALHTRAAGNDEGALLCLQHARAVLPEDVEILNDLGIQAQGMHRLGVASEALQAALTREPANAKALYAMARVEMEQEHFPDAETHLKAYLRERPEDASAHYGLGHLYQMRQQTTEAAKEFERSIALQPVQTEAYSQLGQMALDGHRDEEARAAFAKTLERLPTHGGALTGMGILAYRAKDYAGAERYLSQAVAAAPEYPPAHYYRGLTLRRLGRQDEAERELEKAASLAASQQGKGQPVLAQ